MYAHMYVDAIVQAWSEYSTAVLCLVDASGWETYFPLSRYKIDYFIRYAKPWKYVQPFLHNIFTISALKYAFRAEWMLSNLQV